MPWGGKIHNSFPPSYAALLKQNAMVRPINWKSLIAYAEIPVRQFLTPFRNDLNLASHGINISLTQGAFHLMPIVKDEGPNYRAEKSHEAKIREQGFRAQIPGAQHLRGEAKQAQPENDGEGHPGEAGIRLVFRWDALPLGC